MNQSSFRAVSKGDDWPASLISSPFHRSSLRALLQPYWRSFCAFMCPIHSLLQDTTSCFLLARFPLGLTLLSLCLACKCWDSTGWLLLRSFFLILLSCSLQLGSLPIMLHFLVSIFHIYLYICQLSVFLLGCTARKVGTHLPYSMLSPEGGAHSKHLVNLLKMQMNIAVGGNMMGGVASDTSTHTEISLLAYQFRLYPRISA